LKLGNSISGGSAAVSIPDVKVMFVTVGLAVSGAFDTDGRAWLWGFGTNNQLGKGDDDGDEEASHQFNLMGILLNITFFTPSSGLHLPETRMVR